MISGRRFIFRVFQDFKPIHVRHLHVEKDDIRFINSNRPDCFAPISRFTDYLYLAVTLEQLANAVTREWLIIHN